MVVRCFSVFFSVLVGSVRHEGQTFFFPMHMNPVLWSHHRGEEDGLGIANSSGASTSMLPHAGYHQAPVEQGGAATGTAGAAALISPSHGAFSCGSMGTMSPSGGGTAPAAAGSSASSTAPGAASYPRSQQQFSGECIGVFCRPLHTLFCSLVRAWTVDRRGRQRT